jgi:hypothetical protein
MPYPSHPPSFDHLYNIWQRVHLYGAHCAVFSITSSVLGPNILLDTLFLDILNLCEILASHGGEDVAVGLLGVTPRGFVGRYQRFGETYCLYFVRNIGIYLQVHTALQRKTPTSASSICACSTQNMYN